MDVTIRRIDESGIDRVAPLFDAYRRFYGQPADLDRAGTFLADRLRNDESVILLAERNGMPVGFTQLYPGFSSVRAARTWILNDLYVDASARRSGTGRALLDAAVAFARADGAAALSLETARDNAAARGLYRSAGWSEDATQWYSANLAAAAN